jgi:hypothetical protein
VSSAARPACENQIFNKMISYECTGENTYSGISFQNFWIDNLKETHTCDLDNKYCTWAM